MTQPIELQNPEHIIAAGKLATRLVALREREARDIKKAEQSVRDRYAAKLEALTEGLPEEVLAICGVELE